MEFLNQSFNRCVDIALIVATRLAELPFVLVFAVTVSGVSGVFGFFWIRQQYRGDREPLRRRYARALMIACGAAAAIHMSQRAELVLRESRELQYFVRRDALKRLSSTSSDHAELQLIDPDELEQRLPEVIGPCDVDASVLADGIELAVFHALEQEPLTGYVAVIDLNQPSLQIKITPRLTEKSLTSDFARENDCVVAINGEAGMSPARDAPLGSYVGRWIVDGEQIEPEQRQKRPFLCFDRRNRGTYFATGTPKADVGAGAWNALWGRGDLVRGGEYVATSSARWNAPSPRTLMGLDEAGTRLILIVLDGRQAGYSSGSTLEVAARLAMLFGAHNAMWCDQGGSSTMSLGNMTDVINRPSDGRERPTYTHFGVSLNSTVKTSSVP